MTSAERQHFYELARKDKQTYVDDCITHLINYPVVNVNRCNVDGYTALMIATQYARLGVIRMLLSYEGINVNRVDRNGNPAIAHIDDDDYSYHSENVQCVRQLFECDPIDIHLSSPLL